MKKNKGELNFWDKLMIGVFFSLILLPIAMVMWGFDCWGIWLGLVGFFAFTICIDLNPFALYSDEDYDRYFRATGRKGRR